MTQHGIEAPNFSRNVEPSIIAMDIGGTNTRIAYWKEDELINETVYPTPHNYDQAMAKTEEVIHSLTNKRPRDIDAAVTAIAGEVELAGESATLGTGGMLNDYGWCGRLIGKDMAQALHLDEEYVGVYNDCVTAAKAQQVENKNSQGPKHFYIATISTGFGGASVHGEEIYPDEPGHQILYDQGEAICGCGGTGHVEAYISGSGIERRFNLEEAKDLPREYWDTDVIPETLQAFDDLYDRLKKKHEIPPSVIYLLGSMALKQPGLIIPSLQKHFRARKNVMPDVKKATFEDRSGLVGAYELAREKVRGERKTILYS